MFGNLRIKIKDKISCFEMTDFKMTFPFWLIIGRMGKAFWKRKSQQRFWEEIRPYWTAKELPKAAKRDEFLSKFLRKNPADEWRRKFEKRVAKRNVFQSRAFETGSDWWIAEKVWKKGCKKGCVPEQNFWNFEWKKFCLERRGSQTGVVKKKYCRKQWRLFEPVWVSEIKFWNGDLKFYKNFLKVFWAPYKRGLFWKITGSKKIIWYFL